MDTEELKKQLKEYSPKKFKDVLDSAIVCAERYHKDQYRLSGEPYINHGLRTAITLAQMGMDTDTIIAGLLHNSTHNQPRDSKEIEEEIREKFGDEVQELLICEHEISRATGSTDTEFNIITKFILNNAKDIRPILIKLADTLDNVTTIEYMPADRIKTKLQKIWNIYAPLAEYLNLDRLKKQLEEKALYIYRPEIYEIIKEKMEENSFTQEVKFKYIEYIEKILSEISPKPVVYGRVKSIYSIYNKQKKQLKEGNSLDLSSIRDLIAFRIITDSSDNCFKILEKINPHLILLDLILPGMDGFEILARLKKDPKTSSVPILVLSNLGQKEDIDKAASLGAVDYMIKANFTPGEISERIKSILKKKYL